MIEKNNIENGHSNYAGQKPMVRYYEDEKDNAAFDRWVDVMARLIQKHGGTVLRKTHQSVLTGITILIYYEKTQGCKQRRDRIKIYKSKMSALMGNGTENNSFALKIFGTK